MTIEQEIRSIDAQIERLRSERDKLAACRDKSIDGQKTEGGNEKNEN